MSIIDGSLIALLSISALLGVMVALIKFDVITLKNNQQLTVFYSALVICLLLFFIVLTSKFLMSEDGKKWLDSFSENGDCDKIDRPYWCDL